MTSSGKKLKRIAEIEAEHGLDIEQVFKDYAKLYSWDFTCRLIGSNKQTFKEYKHYFKRFNQPKRESCSWVSESNKRRSQRFDGLTIREMSEISGIHYTTIRHRVKKLGWSAKDAMTVKPVRGDINRMGESAKIGRAKLKENWS